MMESTIVAKAETVARPIGLPTFSKRCDWNTARAFATEIKFTCFISESPLLVNIMARVDTVVNPWPQET